MSLIPSATEGWAAHHALRMDLMKDSRKHLAPCAPVLAVRRMGLHSLAQMSCSVGSHHGLEAVVLARVLVCKPTLGSREVVACHGGCRGSHREKPRCWMIRPKAHAAIRRAYSCVG